jgi:hypothetical protein
LFAHLSFLFVHLQHDRPGATYFCRTASANEVPFPEMGPQYWTKQDEILRGECGEPNSPQGRNLSSLAGSTATLTGATPASAQGKEFLGKRIACGDLRDRHWRSRRAQFILGFSNSGMIMLW